MTSKIKKGAKASDKAGTVIMDMQASVGNLSDGDTSINGHIEAIKYKQPYVSWNKEMDSHLAKTMIEQMAQGNRCDGDTWKPQAFEAALAYLNSKLHLNLTKDNIKNRLKCWKKYFRVVTDVQNNQCGFTWDQERKMIVVTSDEWSSWAAYVESHPDAKGMQNKMIENWDDIVLLCGKEREGQHAETFEEGIKAMGEEEEIDVNSSPISVSPISVSRARPPGSTDFMLDKRKKRKTDSLVEAVVTIATSFQEFLACKKNDKKPSGIEIYEVVAMIPGLNSNEVFKAVRKLINGDPEEFKLLKALPNEKKKEWIYVLINT